MKYNESRYSKFVGSTGFYVIIGCCLLAIGGASWFAVSRYAGTQTPPEPSSKPFSGGTSSYDTDPLPDSVIPLPSESVAGAVSDEPYPAESQPVAAAYFSVPVEGNISKGYSDTELQYSATYGDMRIHTGVDIICGTGAAIKAAGDGTVTAVEDSAAYGKVVTIDHGSGIVVKYCGLAEVSVAARQIVKLGDVLGKLGEIPSECADESHLHIEVYKDGKITSPLKALGLG